MTEEAPKESVGPRDMAVIAGELGRQPRDLTGIAARCPFGYPVVVETAPVMTGGAPNPTLLYVTCPSLAAAISRVESEGGVRKLRASCRIDGQLRRLLNEITRLYQERRTELASSGTTSIQNEARLGAGIGGPEGPEVASCLHAYAAALLAVMTGWLVGVSAEEAPMAVQARQAWARFLPPADTCWCEDGRCARWDTGLRPAAIDVGTISVRLLLAEEANGRLRPVVRKAEVTRLGEGLTPGGRLGEAARRRTAEVVARYAEEARSGGADKIMLVATSAAREAADGEEFMLTLGRNNGIRATVLSGRREAELAYAGASLDIRGESVVMDVGGGSTELICRPEGGSLEAVSLQIGASRATERWIKSDPPTTEEIVQIYEEAGRAFAAVRHQFGLGRSARRSRGAAKRRLVGVAGTVTTLASLDAGLTVYDADRIHLRTLTLESVQQLVARLSALTTEERAALPCVQAGRAQVIVGGAVIVWAAMEMLGYDRLTVSERDLLDGLAQCGV
jgi:exopolyphosphatase/guanosine-5'-triphosphate,3'-diphosphate pyrophosphatase